MVSVVLPYTWSQSAWKNIWKVSSNQGHKGFHRKIIECAFLAYPTRSRRHQCRWGESLELLIYSVAGNFCTSKHIYLDVGHVVTRPFEYVVLRSMIRVLGARKGLKSARLASRSTFGHHTA